MSEPASPNMLCMEVWGGNNPVSSSVELGGLEAWVFSKPYAEAQRGGDVYYLSSCATGRITRILLADVAGHGKAVASTAADLRTLMRRFVNRLDQAEFVRLLNKQFAEMSKAGTFATAIVTTFFAPSCRLTICNAGHPRPLLYRASQEQWHLLSRDGESAEAKVCNLPLGVFDFVEYEHFDVELQLGDSLVTYSDALIEARDADGEMLGEEGLLRIVRLLGDVPSQTLTETLLAEISSRYPENLSDDDVTVLVVRANGSKPELPLRQKLNSLFRFLGLLIGSTRTGAERAPFPDWNLANLGGAIFPVLARRWRARKS